MTSEIKQLVTDTVKFGVACHAWNADKSQIAFSPNTNELRIVDAKTLETKHALFEHDMLIAAIDWHPESNFIVSVGHDRNAFVWTFDDGEKTWKPLLVILRIERAALDVKWSPDGQKFAVSSSAKCVPVCYYDNDNNWWVSKMIKKHKSTVLSVAWHPCSQIVATGSSDFKARVFSAYIDNVDASQATADFGAPVGFGETYCEFSCAGWVHTVAYSPSGAVLAFAGHDSSIQFVTFGGGQPTVQTIRFDFLPFLKCIFLSETKIVAGGHNMNPAIFETSGGSWAFTAFVDKQNDDSAAAAETPANSVKARMNMWQTKDKTGQKEGATIATSTAWLKHQAPISDLKPYGASSFSTTAIDGKLIVWEL